MTPRGQWGLAWGYSERTTIPPTPEAVAEWVAPEVAEEIRVLLPKPSHWPTWLDQRVAIAYGAGIVTGAAMMEVARLVLRCLGTEC